MIHKRILLLYSSQLCDLDFSNWSVIQKDLKNPILVIIIWWSFFRNELPLSQVVDDMKAMTYLNDELFQRIILSDSSSEEMSKARAIIHCILTRRFYPIIGHTAPLTENIEPKYFLKKMQEQLNSVNLLNQSDLDVQQVIIDYGNGKNNSLKNVGFYSKQEVNMCRMGKPKKVTILEPSRWVVTCKY